MDDDGSDVRMRGFRHRVSADDAFAAATEDVEPLEAELVSVTECAGRVLAAAVASDVDVPAFRRSAMDGYAVHAEDTFGASDFDPVRLTLCGTSMPGRTGTAAIARGAACRIMTGAPVPEGADAVLRAEDAREEGGAVLAVAAVPPGKNVGRVGEDVERGDVLLPDLRRLRPQDVGLLASVGCSPVGVVRRPRVRILVSGNELLRPGERPEGVRIVDSNSPMLRALVERDGGVVEEVRHLPDEDGPIRAALTDPGADVIVAAGGSSVGVEDLLPVIMREVGELPVHGVAIRPASPTGIGRVGDARVFLLPGNPVSCLCAYDFFAGPAVRGFGGLPMRWPYRSTELRLSTRLVSQIGRTDYARVAIEGDEVRPLAVSGASVLSSTTYADGFVVVEPESEGLPEGAPVTVWLYDADPGPESDA